jgi:hypothetical protein
MHARFFRKPRPNGPRAHAPADRSVTKSPLPTAGFSFAASGASLQRFGGSATHSALPPQITMDGSAEAVS